MALISSFGADALRKRGTLSTTATRKVFTSFALFTPGCLMIAQVYLGSVAAWSVTIFTLALFTHGAVTAGYLGNGLDIAPNFSGTIFGMANTLSSMGGFLSTWMVGSLTFQNVSIYNLILVKRYIKNIFFNRTPLVNGKLFSGFWRVLTFRVLCFI